MCKKRQWISRTDANMKGVRNYTTVFLFKGKINTLVLRKLVFLSASFDSILFQGRHYWQKKQKTWTLVFWREKQIASPQPLLQLTLKNIYFKSMNLKWQTWPNNLPFPFLYGHLAGRDFSELVNTQKLWPDNQFLSIFLIVAVIKTRSQEAVVKKIAHFPLWLVVRPRKWSQQQELKFDIPDIGREGRWEGKQWWRKLKFYLEFTKLFLFLENHHNTVTVLWNAECKRGFMKLLRGRGKPCLQKVTTIMHWCVKREVIYNPMHRTNSWGEARG